MIKCTSRDGKLCWLHLTGNGNPSIFDLARPAFDELFGQDGIAAGNGSAEWEVESDWTKCEGNLGPFWRANANMDLCKK